MTLTRRKVYLRRSGLRHWGIRARRERTREILSLYEHKHMKQDAENKKSEYKVDSFYLESY